MKALMFLVIFRFAITFAWDVCHLGDKDEEEYDNRLIARGKVMANLKSLEVLVILFIYLFIALFFFFYFSHIFFFSFGFFSFFYY